MPLKSKWSNMGLKKKTLIFSFTVIVIAFTILYIFINIFLPRMYYSYKSKLIEDNVNEFITNLESTTYDDAATVIDEFSFQNNIMIGIVTTNGEPVYTTFKMKTELNNKGPRNEQFQIKNKDNNVTLEKEFYFKQIDKSCKMIIRTPIKMIDEGEIIVQIFFPFALITIVVVALTISIYYSKKISNPIIKIKDVAEKMASLDFTEELNFDGDDEISQLSNSLNTMSKNLNKTITELELVNNKLRLEIDKEKKLEKERREFIATVSHELKSPITIISGQIEGMIYNIGKYKDRDKYLKESYSVIEKMRDLVVELLEISRRDKEEFAIKFDEVNLTKLIKEILKVNYYFVEEKNLNLLEDIEQDVIITGDKMLLEKAISNIVKNAIQHTPNKGEIYISLFNKKLIVRNTGVEIPKDEIENVFKAFYRLDKSRNRKEGNTGLGLYIVKTIFDKHNNIKYDIYSDNNSVLFEIEFS